MLMKLLYLSCHAILEYDELKIFEELGIDYFSLGSYIIPQKPVDPIRPALTKEVDEDLLAHAPMREALPAEFLDKFDVIVIMHKPEWIIDNWPVLKGRRVIWRTIGQSTPSIERRLAPMRDEGLQVVRYSSHENNIRENIGCDAVIHFYKDEEEFGNYNGMNKQVITFAQNMLARGEFTHYDIFERTMVGLPAKVYGSKNEDLGEKWGGYQTYEDLRQVMRDNRVYFYTGTQPASYTLNFIESWMTGIPVVAIGEKWGNSMKIAGERTYAVPDLIENGVNGFVSDDLNYLRMVTEMLLNDHALAKKIGATGRQSAIAYFGKNVIKSKWKDFLFTSM